MAVDYSGINGAIQSIDDAISKIPDLQKALSADLLETDVGDFTQINDKLKNLKTALEDKKSSLETGAKEMKSIENEVKN